MFLFNAESPTAPQSSIAVAVNNRAGAVQFDISFLSAPTSSVLIQGSNVNTDAEYETLKTSTSVQKDGYTDTGGWRFYRAKLATQSAGGPLTVTVSARASA